MKVLGLDAASQRANSGWALGTYARGVMTVEASGLLSTRDCADALCEQVVPQLRGPECFLVAVDAPLGWPAPLADGLRGHVAGQPFAATKDAMFRRTTDVLTAQRLRKTPLEVGADRIARAAHEALTVLQELREALGQPLPLAWSPALKQPAVIEVYPAATLLQHALPASGYKKPDQQPVRERIAAAAEAAGHIRGLAERAACTGDEFDACLCLLAAADFLGGGCLPPTPEQQPLAIREGWMWVLRSPAA